MIQCPLNYLTRGSKARAFFLQSKERGNDVGIVHLISIYATLYLPYDGMTLIQGKCVVLNRRLPVSVVPLPVNLVSERRSEIR